MKAAIKAGLIIVFVLVMVRVVMALPAGKQCTNAIQAGRVLVQLDENGHALQSVMLPNPYCGSYVVTANPQGNASSAEFVANRWYVSANESYQFVIVVEGKPGASVWFHTIASQSYE